MYFICVLQLTKVHEKTLSEVNNVTAQRAKSTIEIESIVYDGYEGRKYIYSMMDTIEIYSI